VTFTMPAVTMSEADIAAVICELLTNVVALPAPLKFTVAPDTNPMSTACRAAPWSV